MVTYTDNFNRAGPGLGANWGDDEYGWDGLEITGSTEVYATIARTNMAYWDEDGGAIGDDGYSEVLLSTMGTERIAGPTARYTTSGSVSTCYVGGYDWDGNDYQRRIFTWDDGGTASLATEAVDIADDDLIQLEVDGTTLTLYINDTQELQTTDGTYTTGYFGMALGQSGGARLDNWEGGDLGAAATTGTGSMAVAIPAITGTAAQELAGTGSLALGNPAISGTGITATLEQEAYRWRNDDDNEADATWQAPQDVNVAAAVDANIRLRVIVNATGDPADAQYQLEYRKVGAGTWEPLAP